jgi:hypothetical protein
VTHIRPAPYEEGDNVEERDPAERGAWRPAVVVAVLPNDEYEVDGAGGMGLKRPRKHLRWPRYAGGDTVQVKMDVSCFRPALLTNARCRTGNGSTLWLWPRKAGVLSDLLRAPLSLNVFPCPEFDPFCAFRPWTLPT